MRTEASFLKIQAWSEAIAICLIVAFIFDYTNIKVLVAGQGVVATFTLIWWMKWEKARLPEEDSVS